MKKHSYIKVVNVNNASSPRTLTLSSSIPASDQQMSPITTSLQQNLIYHLRPEHLAIDSVRIASIGSEQYLLLLQVSLSSYQEHLSRGIDIRRSVQPPERNFVKKIASSASASALALASVSHSITQYYQYLAGNIADDKVIYHLRKPSSQMISYSRQS